MSYVNIFVGNMIIFPSLRGINRRPSNKYVVNA